MITTNLTNCYINNIQFKLLHVYTHMYIHMYTWFSYRIWGITMLQGEEEESSYRKCLKFKPSNVDFGGFSVFMLYTTIHQATLELATSCLLHVTSEYSMLLLCDNMLLDGCKPTTFYNPLGNIGAGNLLPTPKLPIQWVIGLRYQDSIGSLTKQTNGDYVNTTVC